MAIGAVIVVLHAFWFAQSQYRADVISGLGVALADLGVFVTAQPFIRLGITRTALQQYDVDSETKPKDLSAPVDEAERHVLKERVVGVVLIAAGTLFNGYAGALDHLLSSRRSPLGPAYLTASAQYSLVDRARSGSGAQLQDILSCPYQMRRDHMLAWAMRENEGATMAGSNSSQQHVLANLKRVKDRPYRSS